MEKILTRIADVMTLIVIILLTICVIKLYKKDYELELKIKQIETQYKLMEYDCEELNEYKFYNN